MTVTIDKIKQFSLFYLLYGVMFYGYYVFVVPVYGYDGYDWNPDNIKLTESLLLLFVAVIFTPSKFNRPSDILLNLHLIFPIIGMLVLFGAADKPRVYIYMIIFLYIMISSIAGNIRMRPVRLTKLSVPLTKKMLIGVAFLVITSILIFGGSAFLNFNLLRVYEFRSAAAANLPSIYGYITPMVSKVILPTALILAISRKKWLLALTFLSVSILMFGLTGHKGPLFYPFFATFIYFISGRRNPVQKLLIGLVVVLIFSLLYYLYDRNNNILFSSYFLRRAFFVPGHLNYLYFDYFSTHPFVIWSNSKLSFGVFDYPYHLGVPYLIGLEYYSNELTGANTGWIGSGFMQMGFTGMVIYATILSLTLCFINSYSKLLDKRIIVAIAVTPILAVMQSSDLPASFLTHGILLSLILLMSFVYKSKTRPILDG